MQPVKNILIIAVIGASVAGAVAAQATRKTVSLSPESRVWFDGTSTVRGFSCSATRIESTVQTDVAGISALPDQIVKAAEVVIAASALDCKNGSMNGHMRKALKATEHPNISWRMTSYRVDADSVIMSGQLSIAGKENPIELRAFGQAADGSIRVKGTVPIRMTEFGVKPPTLMLGTMRVHDAVTVKFDVALNP